MSSLDTLRVGVVGCGFQGRLHVDSLRAVPGAEVVAVCDRDRARADAVAAELGVAATHDDHRELLARHELDLVTVCTMPDSHREIVVDAFAAGTHVLCEKPLAPNLSDARVMVDAAARAQRTLTVGFNLRHTTAAVAVSEFVKAGGLGRPICARGSMLETVVPWWGPHQAKAVSGGGALASTGVHMLDLLMWLAGIPEPRTATASMAQIFPSKRGGTAPRPEAAERYDVEDLVFGHVRFDSGFWLTLEASWVWDEPGSECAFVLVGDRGHAAAPPLRFWADEAGTPTDVTGRIRGDLDFPSSVRRELAEVVAALRAGRAPLGSGPGALRVQAVVDALYRSAEVGAEVAVDARGAVEVGDHPTGGAGLTEPNASA